MWLMRQNLAGHASIDDIMQILPALGELCVEEGVPFAREDLVNTVGDLVDFGCIRMCFRSYSYSLSGELHGHRSLAAKLVIKRGDGRASRLHSCCCVVIEDGSGSIDKKEFCVVLGFLPGVMEPATAAVKLLRVPRFSSLSSVVVSRRKVRVSCTWQRDCDPSPSWPPGAHQTNRMTHRHLRFDGSAVSDVAEELHYITAQTKVKVDRLGPLVGHDLFNSSWISARAFLCRKTVTEWHLRCESLLAGIAQYFETETQAQEKRFFVILA